MLRDLLMLLAVLLAGAVAGVLGAHWAADQPALAGMTHVGVWRSWPKGGVADASPYARLHYYIAGNLPPSPVDRLELLADTDDSGDSLSANCDYELRGRMLPVRSWILGVDTEDEAPRAHAVLHAENVIHQPDASLRISLSRQPRAGNWLPMPPGQERVRLILQLFGISPLQRERLLKTPPFTIHRLRCS